MTKFQQYIILNFDICLPNWRYGSNHGLLLNQTGAILTPTQLKK